MTSKIKVDNINKVSDDSNIIKKCGTTTTIGSGASNPIVVDGSAITLGRCGGTVALASGATQTGFGRTGTVNWQTGSIKTGTFTAANGEGYFCNTTGGAFTVNLPAGSAGNIVSVQDYNNTFDTNALTITPNGSEKINGGLGSIGLGTEGEGLTLVYIDSTVGWRSIQDSDFATAGSNYIAATGGTETTSGDFKIHTFTGPGSFVVSAGGSPAGSNTVSYVVVGGGAGGGGSEGGGGGGAGGYRESKASTDTYTASPLNATSGPGYNLPVTATTFPITVGGAGSAGPRNSGDNRGGCGTNSIFSTITSAGGGGGGGGSDSSPHRPGNNGGSGGGGGETRGGPGNQGTGGTGNTPPVSPAQGRNGGDGNANAGNPAGAGGGGGATCNGAGGNPSGGGGGGNGATSEINTSPVTRAGGGGGGVYGPAPIGAGGPGGGGDGGRGTPCSGAQGGTANTGGGGGGAGQGPKCGAGGGSGIVIIRYKFQN